MNGADSLLATAAALGLDVCFANPGTTEMPLVTAMDRYPEIRPILGLFEGVCTGAADGYGRMTGRPALTLLHLGPGLANGMANLHNARKARTPVINLVGDNAIYHLNNDSALSSDVVGLARTVSLFVRQSLASSDVSRDLQAGYRAAVGGRGVATLAFPSDVLWGDAETGAVRDPSTANQRTYQPLSIDTVAPLIKSERTALLLDGNALLERGVQAAARISAATGCRLLCSRAPARIEYGIGRPACERLGYFPDQFIRQFDNLDAVILVGAEEPTATFAYRGQPTRLIPNKTRIEVLASPTEDGASALEALADVLNAPAFSSHQPTLGEPPSGPLARTQLGAALAALQPEGAIVIDESNTAAPDYFECARAAPPFTYMGLTGGAIGIGSPLAIGAAVACPDRPIIAMVGDGSAMYTFQGLWTQAREGLNVTTLICSNRQYRILQIEQRRAGIPELGPAAAALTELRRPEIEWTSLAAGLGVPGAKVSSHEELSTQLRVALNEPGPHLLELMLP